MLPSLGIADNAQLRLLITATSSTVVTVTFLDVDTSVTQFVETGAHWELIIPRGRIEVIGQQETRSDRALRISSDAPVTVQAFHDAVYFTDGWVILPTEGLGVDHRVMSFGSENDLNLNGGVAAVVATENNTTLRITPTVATASGNSPGFTYGITLNQGEVWQVVPQRPERTDMSGTQLQADHPIAVISGHRGTDIVPGIGATNPLVETIPPIHQWGKEFYAIPPPERDTGYYKFVAAENGTVVQVNGNNVGTLNAGQSLQHREAGAATITASKPILVAEFAVFQQSDVTGRNADPSMTLVQPTRAWESTYLWTTPSLDPRPWPGPTNPERYIDFTHFVMVTVPAGSTDPVRLDGVDISAQLTTLHPGGAYRSGIIEIEEGTHSLRSPIPIAAQLIGYNHFDAYFLPAGYRVPQPLESAPLIGSTCRDQFDTTIIVRSMRGSTIRVAGAVFTGISGTVTSPSLPFDLPPFSERSVGIRLTLPSFGTQAGTIRFRLAGDTLPELEVPVRITRDSLAGVILESQLTYPDATQGNPVRDTTIRVVNTGTKPIRVDGASIPPPFEVLNSPFPATVAPGDTLELRLRFAPAAPGEYNRTLRLTTAPCDLMLETELRGRRSDPALLDVQTTDGPTLLCPDDDPGEVTITLRNRGGEPITVTDGIIEGEANGDYQLIDDPAGRVLLPGDSTVVRVRFIPTDTGVRRAVVRILHDLSPGYTLVEINARKDSVGVDAVEDLIEFGAQITCAQPTVRSIRLRNTGTVSLTIDSIRFAFGTHYTLSPDPATTIASGDSGEIGIIFAPKESGVWNDTLLLSIAPCDTLLRVPITGQGRLPDLSVLTDTLDFGGQPFCLLPDTLTARLLNNGGAIDTITSIEILGEGFQLGNAPESIIPEGEERSFNILFAPDQTSGAKEYRGEIVVRFGPCDLERRIYLKGSVLRLEIQEPISGIEFGDLFPNISAQGRTTLRNSGELPVSIDSLDSNALPEGVQIISPSFPVTIAPGEEIELLFDYLSDDPKPFEVAIALFSSPCPLDLSITLRGDRGPGAMVLILPDTAAPVDATVDIPLRLSGAEGLAGPVRLITEVRWDLRNLLLRDVISGSGGTLTLLTNKIEGEERILQFEYNGTIPSDGLLGRLRTLVLLGNDDTTGLDGTIISAELSGSGTPLQVTAHDGSFKTLGICVIDGERLIEFGNALKLAAIRPNPVSERAEVDLNADRDGHVEVRLYDMLGVQRRTIYSGELAAGAYTITLDVRGLTPGLYICELRSGERRIQQSVLIID